MRPSEIFGRALDKALDRAPPRLAAGIDLRRPMLWDSWGGPFNGQRGRQAMLRDLVGLCGFTEIVETGTFRGVTTQFLSDISGSPVHSCELFARYFRFSSVRLASRDIELENMDSRAFLLQLASRLDSVTGPVLFYLDAHWREDLPLAEELRIIAPRWPKSVVLVDDFQVADDPGYVYDDYGPGKVLNESLIPVECLDEWAVAYPSLPSRDETGFRTGCCVLIGPPMISVARQSAHLRITRTL